ncbi:MAG: hypothetical protein R2712_00880 [Vicinamibacterales bacterium]
MHARSPSTFFAENTGGVCRISPRNRPSAASSASRVGRASDSLTTLPWASHVVVVRPNDTVAS